MDLFEQIALDHGEDRAALAIVSRLQAGRERSEEKRAKRKEGAHHRIALPLPRICPRHTKPIAP